MNDNLGGEDLFNNVDAAEGSSVEDQSTPSEILPIGRGVADESDLFSVTSSQFDTLSDAEMDLFTIPTMDDVGNPVEYLKLTSELLQLLPRFIALKASEALADKVELMKVTARAMEIQRLLGKNASTEAEPSNQDVDPAPDTSAFFEFNPDIKPSARQKANKAAISLLADIKLGRVDGSKLTEEQKTALAKYSGNGGGMIGADGLSGSAYEYYTPKPLAEGVWSLLDSMGFAGGKVLDPAAGTGIFGATSPKNAVIDAIELDETSGMVNKLVNGSPKNNVTISAFESIAANTPDETYDAIVTNVPFGDNAARGKEKLKDPRYQSESLEAYFILRSLEKLRPNGLACFVTSKAFVSNPSESKLRYKTSLKAEFMGAYRLPNKMFDAAGADVTTDVIVFRKYSNDAREKIEELAQQNPDKLHECKVLWDEFLVGGYFKGDGLHNVLGRTEMGRGRFGDVEKVVSDDSIANISKLLKRLPDSRIDWAGLNAAPTTAIQYQDGDSIAVAGRTMTYKNGVFVQDPPSEKDAEIVQIGENLFSPLQAVNTEAKWEDAVRFNKALQDKADYKNIPLWIKISVQNISSAIPEADRSAVFDVLKTAFALQDVVNQHVTEEPFNYAEVYPVLSTAIRLNVKNAKKIPATVPKQVREVASLLGIWYITKTQSFRDRWNGTSLSEVVINELRPTQKYERAKYEMADDNGFVPLDHLAEVMGEGFDPLESDEWCVSSDGKGVMSSDDFYSGNYAEFLERNRQDIASIGDPVLREKLVRQRQNAQDRLVKTDISALTIDLNSPLVSIERKVEFLRKYVHSGFSVLANGDTPEIAFDGKKTKGMSDNDLRNMKRFADYLKRGVLSTLTSEAEIAANRDIDKVRIERLKKLITSTNQKFDAWCKSNTGVQDGLRRQFDNPKNIYFKEVDDETPLDIDGLNPDFHPHDYQNGAIRRYAKRMSGILGFDVGLGKTFTSLATIQHVQSIGVKKKTIFAVPNAVLTNWRKEAIACYKSTDDCLFVGLDVDANGVGTLNSSNYARDLNTILENKHRKIFVTYEALGMIPMREGTIEEYERHLSLVDQSYNSSDTKSKSASIIKEGKLKGVTDAGAKGSAAVPFFEDMGIDSIVVDEGHSFKNSKETVEFKAAKFLSDPATSNRGLDMQMKTWYIRGKSKLNDGALILTATPITNSPLEIYSMLTLAIGEDEVNRRMGGVRGSDAFMQTFCSIGEEEVVSLAGVERLQRVFTGLQNTNLLRSMLNQVANIKSARQVDLKIPDAEEISTSVELPASDVKELQRMQAIYSAASKMARGKDVLPQEEQMVLAYQEISREPIDLIGHPFNFINKVSKLIADPELARQTTVYVFGTAQAELANKVVTEFNAKKFTEERNRPSLAQDQASIISRKIKKSGADSGENDVEVLKVLIVAKIVGEKIVIDTEDIDTQNKFLKIAEKSKLNLDVTISPKLAVFLENFKQEDGSPRGKGKAKQLIFCDMLSLHNKIKILLKNRCGIDPSKIIIVNGVTISDAADMQDTQDGFNAEGDENRYRVVIANKKAEVGVNYQKGTQAIHHLTVGWTPDSIHQRNGRGVRQGNYVGKVTIYHYDADGTFDEYKRGIVSKKADWIGELVSDEGGNSVKIAGGISNSDIEMLAEAAGSAEGMRKVREKIANREMVERKRAAKDALTSNLEIMLSQVEIISKYKIVNYFAAEKVADAAEAYQALKSAKARKSIIGDSDDPKAIARADDNLAKAQANYDRVSADVVAGMSFSNKTMIEHFESYGWLISARGSNVRNVVDREQIISDVSTRVNIYVVNQDSSIADEYSQELSVAESLARDSEAKARSYCNDAGVSVGRIEEAKSGAAKIVRGQIVGTGDFVIDKKDRLHIVKDGKNLNLAYFDEENKRFYPSDSEVIFSGLIVTQEHPDQTVYFDTVRRAAAIDDSIIENGKGGLSPDAIGNLYSASNIDVKNALKAQVKLKVLAEMVVIPSPKYPYILPDDADKSIPIIKSIYDEQAQYFTSTEADYSSSKYVLVEDGIDLRGRYDSASSFTKIQNLCKYAVAHEFKINSASIRSVVGFVVQGSLLTYLRDAVAQIFGSIPESVTLPLIQAATTEDEIKSTIKALYVDKYPLIDWTDEVFSGSIETFYSYGTKNAIANKIRALNAPPPVVTPTEAEPSPKVQEEASAISSGTVTELSPADSEFVAIIGNTYAMNKEENLRTLASGIDEKIGFKGAKRVAPWDQETVSKLPNAPVNSWVASRKFYYWLLENKADSIKKYNISIA